MVERLRPSTTSNAKDLKFAEQSPFTGKAEHLEFMLREAEVRFSVQEQIYDTATKKAFYVLSLFKSGNAFLWKEQYLRQREGKTLCEGDNWENFKNLLKASFTDVGSKDEAMIKLQRMRQKKDQTIDEFNTYFRVTLQKAGLDEQDNAPLLIQMYSQAIRQEIAKRIIMQGAPALLSLWMRQAALVDGYERRANQFFSNAAQNRFNGKGKSTWKPKLYVPKEPYMGEPMQID